MSKYDRFEDFMNEVVREADKKCQHLYSVTLNELYKIKKRTIVDIIINIITKGSWRIFDYIVSLILLGTIAFKIASAAFLSTPAGLIVGSIGSGGYEIMELLYQNKQLPKAIKDTGNKYKSDYKKHLST